MMMSNLPGDLVEEILTRVPLKSMRAVRLTCKKWNALSKSRSFLKMRIGKQEAALRVLGESRMIVMKDYNVYLKSLFVNENSSIEPQGKLTILNNSEQVKISHVYHCEGLLLCILKDDTRIVVCNPYLGQTRWIETRYTYRLLDYYSYAIGYENEKNKSCRTHKILRFIDMYRGMIGKEFSWYEIYDFDSGLWTTLDDVTVARDWYIKDSYCGVSVKGNTYWRAKENNSVVDHIICFDFTREKFVRFLPLPYGDYDNVYLSCVGDEKLAVFLQEDFEIYALEIWITTKIEAKDVSWSKFMTVDTIPLPCWGFIRDGFVIDEEKKVAMVIDNEETVYIIGEAGYITELDLGEPPNERDRSIVSSYVPSLEQIKQHEGGKTKKQSKLEKRLCDQYMSRLVALEEEEAKWRKRCYDK